MDEKQRQPRLSLMGLWENEGRDGRVYLRGRLGNLTVWVFRNDRKTQDNHPDWNVFVTEDRKAAVPGREERGTPPHFRSTPARAERGRSAFAPPTDETPTLGGSDDEDTIPF